MTISKTLFILAVSTALLFSFGCDKKEGASKEPLSSLLPQKVCPVMGGEIDKTIPPVIKDGRKIYMCCEHCRKEMTEEFDANVKKLKELGQKPEKL